MWDREWGKGSTTRVDLRTGEKVVMVGMLIKLEYWSTLSPFQLEAARKMLFYSVVCL